MNLSNLKTLVPSLIILAALVIGCNQSEQTQKPANSAAPSAAASPAGGTEQAKDISGSYTLSGKNADGGGEYGGDLQVTKRDDVYQFSWTSAGRQYDGVGVQTGNAVAVSFTEGTNGKGCGVVLYKIGADGKLDGRAGYWGVNSAETETATRTKGTDLDGEYDVAGTNPDGQNYKGTLAVQKAGPGYSFSWNVGSPLRGFGIKMGDKAAVGFGGSQCGFVGYEIKPDGTLDGKWGGQGTTQVGTEVATKK